jgi:hypothetical protein
MREHQGMGYKVEASLTESGKLDVVKYVTTTSTVTQNHREARPSGTLNFTASVTYQRLTGTPQIYAFDNMSVTNSAFPDSGDAIPTLHYTAGDGHTIVPAVTVTINAYIQQAIEQGSQYLHIVSGNSQTGTYNWDANSNHYHFPNTNVVILTGQRKHRHSYKVR